ncbi:hypothetical protein DB347_17660 [Opitutaceae bacterium EW11]|nr:hypothetical protein DB347_17660 [Opitutaceae bacterium EW11]
MDQIVPQLFVSLCRAQEAPSNRSEEALQRWLAGSLSGMTCEQISAARCQVESIERPRRAATLDLIDGHLALREILSGD